MYKQTIVVIGKDTVETFVHKTKTWIHVKVHINGKYVGGHSIRR